MNAGRESVPCDCATHCYSPVFRGAVTQVQKVWLCFQFHVHAQGDQVSLQLCSVLKSIHLWPIQNAYSITVRFQVCKSKFCMESLHTNQYGCA